MPSARDEGRYRLLVDAITDYAIFMVGPTGEVTSWNRGAERATGYGADEIIGQGFARFHTPEERAEGVADKALAIAAETGRFEREGAVVRKNGSTYCANLIIEVMRSPDGELTGFAVITRDLTERRAAEDSLRRSEEQFRLLVQGVTDYAIFMLDLEGRVASWNAGAQRIKGYAPEEIIGQHFSRFYTEEDRAAGVPFQGLDAARREGRWEQEGLRCRKDGSTFWAHVVIDAICDDSGKVIGFAKITRDITERREAQLALDSTREALFQVQKVEALGQLTGGVAHDFNNLLMAALGSVELLRKRLPCDPKLTPLVDSVEQAIQRGATLTERMLAFARRQELNVESIDVAALLRGLHPFLQRSIGPRVRIEMCIPADLPPGLSDANQLESALLNLVLNARDALGGVGAVAITARSERLSAHDEQTAPGDYVVLSVSDTGEGMNAKTLARATEPFFSTKGVGKGTGLGLSMVQGLVAQSGGVLSLVSEKGKGTTVEMWLRQAEQAPAQPQVRNGKKLRDKRLVVLLVDDDSLVLTNTAALLEDLGHFVVATASAAEALDALEVHPDIDVVVTDQAMPQMTGSELARRVGKRRPGLPIVLATGFADPDAEKSRLPRLRKPFTQAQLREALLQANPNWV
jgi:PAS domain S-box-containing protein